MGVLFLNHDDQMVCGVNQVLRTLFQDISNDLREQLLGRIRLHEIDQLDLMNEVKMSGLFTPSAILDAIQRRYDSDRNQGNNVLKN